MRTIVMTVLLATLALAGCLDSDELGTDSGELNGNIEDKAGDQANLTAKPDKRFEPELRLTATDLFIDKGDTAHIEFHISDLHDYEYPTSFIDWNLTYLGEPNPVEEGDADALPGTYERVLYRDGNHNFTFAVDDGQGFSENRTISIWVGPVPEPEPEEEEGEGGSGEEIATKNDGLDVTIATLSSCSIDGFATGATCGALGAEGCLGFNAGENGIDCAWVEIPGAGGTPFTLNSEYGDPDGVALTSCSADAEELASYGAIGPEAGTLPAGTGCLLAWEWLPPAPGAITFHVDPWYEAGASGGDSGGDAEEETGPEFPDDPKCETYDAPIDAAGYYAFPEGLGGFWIYQESNGIEGLQRGGADGYAKGCVNHDSIIF